MVSAASLDVFYSARVAERPGSRTAAFGDGAADRDMAELEMVYGYGGRFADETTVADLDEALASIPEQLERGFTTICIKPSQFIDDPSEMRSVPRPSRGARFTWRTLATRGRVREPRYASRPSRQRSSPIAGTAESKARRRRSGSPRARSRWLDRAAVPAMRPEGREPRT